MKNSKRVSIHGGHSGEFCHHAVDSLEEIVQTYIENRFSWVGITEHAPPVNDDLRYPDEKEAGLSADFLFKRFGSYIKECRRLKEKHARDITLYVGMEIETYSGYEEFVPHLLKVFSPDYLVGSVHFVDDIGFDFSRIQYEEAVEVVGGIDTLYCRYFDLQYQMLSLLRPAVVGHFDLIRLFDEDYRRRLCKPDIAKRIERNLLLVKDLDLIIDYNLRALMKGADEPYPSDFIVQKALDLGISVVPGDDSHGCSSVGVHIDEGIALLEDLGCNTEWKPPVIDENNVSIQP